MVNTTSCYGKRLYFCKEFDIVIDHSPNTALGCGSLAYDGQATLFGSDSNTRKLIENMKKTNVAINAPCL